MKFFILLSSLVVLMACGNLVNGKDYPGVPRIEGRCTLENLEEKDQTLCAGIKCEWGLFQSETRISERCPEPPSSTESTMLTEGNPNEKFPKCCPKFAN